MLNKILFLVFSIILFVAGYFVIWNAAQNNDISKREIIEIHINDCDFKNKCSAESNEFKMKISFDDNIYYLKPFNVSITNENKGNVEIESIQIDFKMKNMDMGVNRFMLQNIDSKNDRQSWQGKALLPICVTGRADWISELEVVTKNYKHIISLPISVKKAIN